ncbi:MAG: hypothetical protein WDW36_006297 [Sanguina aurantia]
MTATVLLEAGTTSSIDMEKIIRLLTGPNSAELYDRHLVAINKLLQNSRTGFSIRDLPKVQTILEITLRLLATGVDMLLQPSLDLLQCLSKPYIRRTATDDVKLTGNISSLLSCVGSCLMSGCAASVRLAALDMLNAFGSAHGSRPNILDLPSQHPSEQDAGSQHRQFHTNQSLVASSAIIPLIVQALASALLQQEAALLQPLTRTLLCFSYHPDNCTQMVSSGVLACLPLMLRLDPRCETVSMTVELTWNLLDFAPHMRTSLGNPQPLLFGVAQGECLRQDSLPDLDATYVSELIAGAEDGREILDPYITRLSSTLLSTSNPWHRSSGGTGEYGTEVSPPQTSDAAEAIRKHQARSTSRLGASLVSDSAQAEDPPSCARSRPVSGGGMLYHDGGAHTLSLQVSPSQPGAATGTGTTLTGPISRPQTAAPSAALATSLCGLFQVLLLGGFRHQDKQLRNDVITLLNLLLEDLQFMDACRHLHLFDVLLATCTCPELPDASGMVKPYMISTEDLDYELRLIMWACVSRSCSRSPEVMRQAARAGFAKVLLMFVSLTEGAEVRRWNPDQLTTLRGAALSRLSEVAALCPKEYTAAGGIPCLVNFISDVRNASHLEAALRHLLQLAQSAPQLRTDLCAASLLPPLLAVIRDPASPEGVRLFGLLLLSTLCGAGAEVQRLLRKAEGVQVLLGQVSALRGMDPTLPSPPGCGSVGRCVALHHPRPQEQSVLLGAMADLLENPKSHPFFHNWRSDGNGQSAAHLLISLWQEEDGLRGITSDGLLTNTARPLVGLDRRTNYIPKETVAYGNLSHERREALQVMLEGASSDALLSKIYALFRVLGYDTMPYLDAKDQAVLVVVEKYVKFKQGEVWREIEAEFAAEGIEPTSPDKARLASGMELSEHLAVLVRDAQAVILGRAQDALRQTEARFFEDMRNQKKLENEARKKQQRAGAPLTLVEMRSAKEKKETMLKNSFAAAAATLAEDLFATGLMPGS